MSENFEAAVEVDGSLFKFLGFEDSEELEAKGELLVRIHRAMQSKDLNQSQLAKAIGMHRSEVSKLLRGDLERFSIERLMKALRDLGMPVRIAWLDEVVPLVSQG